jgi:hypothetical protein
VSEDREQNITIIKTMSKIFARKLQATEYVSKTSENSVTFWMSIIDKYTDRQAKKSKSNNPTQRLNKFRRRDNKFSMNNNNRHDHMNNENKHLSACKSEKWAVITSIAPEPTKAMLAILNNTIAPDWCLVVIGDEKSPDVFPSPNNRRLVYLNLNDQGNLPFRTTRLSPTNSFSRKNIGFLYAIQQGAEVIFDVDDDNIPLIVESEGKAIPFISDELQEFIRPLIPGENEQLDNDLK